MKSIQELNFLISEGECQIKKPLEDTEVTEEQTVTLVLEITKSRKVTWKKAGKPIKESDRFKIEVKNPLHLPGTRTTTYLICQLFKEHAFYLQ